MTGVSIDFTAVVAIVIAGMLISLPLVGLTLRYGFTPLIGAVAELRRTWNQEGDSAIEARTRALEERVAELEAARQGNEAGVHFA